MKQKFSWIVALFFTVFLVMAATWIMKKAANKYNIPVVSTIVKEA